MRLLVLWFGNSTVHCYPIAAAHNVENKLLIGEFLKSLVSLTVHSASSF